MILHNRFASLGRAIGPGLAELDGMDYPGIPLRVKYLDVYNETLIYRASEFSFKIKDIINAQVWDRDP